MSHIIIVRVYQLMQFFNLKLSYMRYQVILFSTCSYGTPRFYVFLDWNWDLNLICLRYQISYVMCQLMSNMSHLFVLPKSACLFFYNLFLVYLLVFFCYSMARKRELKMPNLPPLRGGRREQCQGWEELNYVTVDNLSIFTS